MGSKKKKHSKYACKDTSFACFPALQLNSIETETLHFASKVAHALFGLSGIKHSYLNSYHLKARDLVFCI